MNIACAEYYNGCDPDLIPIHPKEIWRKERNIVSSVLPNAYKERLALIYNHMCVEMQK